ncbi:MAG: hypothetical protein ABI925_11990 [Verrucomicrobiota bacterium]
MRWEGVGDGDEPLCGGRGVGLCFNGFGVAVGPGGGVALGGAVGFGEGVGLLLLVGAGGGASLPFFDQYAQHPS